MNKGPLIAKLRTFDYQRKLTWCSRGLREFCLPLPVVLPGRKMAAGLQTQESDGTLAG
jgi:hypothetical protein